MTREINDPSALRDWVFEKRAGGKTVGLVPTMGAYHEGHRALMRESVGDNDVTVVSLFVNPNQFNSDESAEAYPRDFERDRRILDEESVDVVFHPEADDVYQDGDCTKILVQNRVTEDYEGAFKSRFFPGVARIVSKLLNIVPGHRVYFGEKDLQQLLMVRRMMRDLHFPHELVMVPVVRDEDGVARSSRNRRLDDGDWDLVRFIRTVMENVKNRASTLDRSDLDGVRDTLKDRGVDLDYLDAIQYPTFEPVDPSGKMAVIVVAGRVGGVRIKDNLPLHADSIRELDQRLDS